MDFIYYVFHCGAGDDGTGSKHEMAVYGMDLVSTQLLSSFLMIVMGACNIRFNSFLLYVIVLLPIPFISYYLINGYYIKSGRHVKILEKYTTTTNTTKTFYKIIVIIMFLVSFILMFVGGMAMSYLLSLYE